MRPSPNLTDMRKRRRSLAVATCGSLMLALLGGVPASGAPTCPDEPRTACGGRIFPEAENTVSHIQHDNGEYETAIKALARDFPRFVKVKKIDRYVGHPVESVGGRPIWIIEVTDFEAPARGKVPVVVSLSVHGPERAGIEGGVRYVEDLARWAKDEPDHTLRNGTQKDSVGIPVSKVLEKVHLYVSNINPDGWGQGDVENGGNFQRGNANGVDLNREFPTKGWSYPPYTALSEPETKAWDEFVRKIRPRVAGDIHGELTSANNAFADIMLPAGQWHPLEQEKEHRTARHMASNIARYFEQEGVEASTVSGVAGMQPAAYATGFDVVGYDAAGFMGDYFTERIGAVDIDVEHFLSHMAPNSTWIASLEEAHIMAVRAEIETFLVEAIELPKVEVRLRLGRTGYFNDPRVVTDADGYGGPKPPKGVKPESYRATRMRYFRHLSRFAGRELKRVTPRTLRRGVLDSLDTLVLADSPFGNRYKGKARQRRRAVDKIERFVKRGGNLVLTDRAIKLLAPLGVVGKKAVQRRVYTAGHIDIHDWEDRYVKGLPATASQTYYEVPLGYSIDEDTSPHWIVRAAALERASGKAVAHIEDESEIGLGRVKLGRGTIGFIGALLPQPTERYDHFYGLADYGVSVTGGIILNHMIREGL